MLWFLLAPFDFLFTVLCYFLNPFVALFADKHGNLPKCLSWFQTYDNCLDVDWFVKEKIFDIFKYDFDKHYIYHAEDNTSLLIPGHVEVVDGKFTIKEIVQRYFCRLGWMYRNCGYGFSYGPMGRNADFSKQFIIANSQNAKGKIWFSYIDDGRSFMEKTWCFYWEHTRSNGKRVRFYLGWKIKNRTIGSARVMMANHLNLAKK